MEWNPIGDQVLLKIEKTAEKTTVNVDAESNVLKKVGSWTAKLISKKLNKKPKQ
jgi:hypothetical protein